MQSTKLSYLIERFLQYKELVENCSLVTVNNYRSYLKNYLKWLGGDKNVNEITPDHILDFHIHLSHSKNKKGEPFKRKSQREYFVALRSFFKFLNENDIPALSHTKIKLPKPEPSIVNYLTAEEINKMFEAVSGDDIISLRNRAILEVLYCTGTRISEILSVNRDQIDFQMGEFSVLGKGKKVRVVFLSDRATQALLQYFKKRTDDFQPMFIDHSTNNSTRILSARLTRWSVAKIVRETAKNVGITKKVTPHVYRHSIATHMLQGGVDLRTIQRFLGHSTIRSTEIYTHVTDPHLRRTVKRFHVKVYKVKNSNSLLYSND